MSQVTESVDVNVPISAAYDQWTQVETFPQFMEGVTSVTQLDDTRNHWTVEVGGATRSSTPGSPSSTPTSASPGRQWAATCSSPAW